MSVTLAPRREIRTLSKQQRKLLRSPFGFQNCTKTAKYEALEKNVVSNAKLPSRRQFLVRSFSYKSLSLLGILRPIDRVRWQTDQLDGGGRGPGIEPSPRFPSSPRGPGGQGSKEGDSGQPLAAFRTCLGDRWRQTRKPVRRLPSGCLPHPPKPYGASRRPNWGARGC